MVWLDTFSLVSLFFCHSKLFYYSDCWFGIVPVLKIICILFSSVHLEIPAALVSSSRHLGSVEICVKYARIESCILVKSLYGRCCFIRSKNLVKIFVGSDDHLFIYNRSLSKNPIHFSQFLLPVIEFGTLCKSCIPVYVLCKLTVKNFVGSMIITG